MKASTLETFAQGRFRFGVQQKVKARGEWVAMWSQRNALVIKVLTEIVQVKLKPFASRDCYHLKGHGGLKGAVREVAKDLGAYQYFCKTDVKSYYGSIDHYLLLTRLHDFINDGKIIGYIWQFLNRCVEWGGLYRDIRRGIPKGSSLPALLGAFYLMDLDNEIENLNIRYFRYMDDILILAPTRWRLKRAIRVLNHKLRKLKLEKHPDKTMIGRVEKGFEFLGYAFRPKGLGVSKKAVKRFREHIARLYEQGAGFDRIGQYRQRWIQYVKAGLQPTCAEKFSCLSNSAIEMSHVLKCGVTIS